MKKNVAALTATLAAWVVFGTDRTATLAQSQFHGSWFGVSHVQRVADLDVVTQTVTLDCQFWFTVGATGSVSGNATAMYNGAMDDGKLRAYLGMLSSGKVTALSFAPNVGALLGLSEAATDTVGLRFAFAEGVPVRTQRISGKLDAGNLTVRWSDPPRALPYQTFRVAAVKETVATSAEAPAYSCWPGTADVQIDAAGNGRAVAATTVRGKNKVVTTGIWSAVRR